MIKSSDFNKPKPTPPPPSEFDDEVSMSSNKLWTNDAEIHKVMSNKYSILSTNVRSLSKNHSELAQIARKYRPDVIVLSEIWNPHPGAAHLNGFHEIKMKTRLSTKGGGVGLYFSKKHKFEMLENLNNQHMKCLEVI